MCQTIHNRRGLTMTELLVASTIMMMIAIGMATVATTVHSANSFSHGRIVAAQHARVALDRIEYALIHSVASEQFPACLVVTEQAGSQELPQTLVVWSPTGAAATPTGLPLVSELVIIAPDPAQPAQLTEFRALTNNSTVPAASDVTSWRTLTDSIKSSLTTDKIVITDKLRTAPTSGQWTKSLSASQLRGTVRFNRLMAPSDQEWSQYKAGTRTWANLSWPLGSFRQTSGTRAVVCQTELQIVTGDMASASITTVPFFGSTQRMYELAR